MKTENSEVLVYTRSIIPGQIWSPAPKHTQTWIRASIRHAIGFFLSLFRGGGKGGQGALTR